MNSREKRLEIGRRLRKVRRSRDQRAFAATLGTVQQTVSKREHGEISGSWLFLADLGEQENVDLNELLKGTSLQIGEKIKKIRSSRDQRTFAAAVDSAQQTISKYERGELPRSWLFLSRLAEQENVDLNTLLIGLSRCQQRAEREQLEAEHTEETAGEPIPKRERRWDDGCWV
jgi:transcriptional regulator with XRE-family HTH domain